MIANILNLPDYPKKIDLTSEDVQAYGVDKML